MQMRVSFVFGLVCALREEALMFLTTPEFFKAKLLVPGLVLFYLFGIMGHLSVNLPLQLKNFSCLLISVVGLFLNILLNVF